MAARLGDRGGEVGTCIRVNIVAVIESVIQVWEPMVGTRGSPGMGVVVAMRGACK